MKKEKIPYMATIKVFNNYYAIFNYCGEPLYDTISFQRKICIENFIKAAGFTWEDCLKKYGWSCHKVNVTINPTKSLY